MALMGWRKSYSVGIELIDRQHQKLLEMINQLHEAMSAGRGRNAMGKIIDGLVSYAETHFATEERYFDEFEYPDALSHKMEHNEFVKKITDFQTNYSKGRLSVTFEVMNFMNDWLIDHIQGTDMKYSPFFKQKGLN